MFINYCEGLYSLTLHSSLTPLLSASALCRTGNWWYQRVLIGPCSKGTVNNFISPLGLFNIFDPLSPRSRTASEIRTRRTAVTRLEKWTASHSEITTFWSPKTCQNSKTLNHKSCFGCVRTHVRCRGWERVGNRWGRGKQATGTRKDTVVKAKENPDLWAQTSRAQKLQCCIYTTWCWRWECGCRYFFGPRPLNWSRTYYHTAVLRNTIKIFPNPEANN